MSNFETEIIRIDVDNECSKIVATFIFNAVSYKLKELGEVVGKNLETYDLLLSHFPIIMSNKKKLEEDTLELSRKIVSKIAEVYNECKDSFENNLYARTVFWRALMGVFSAIMLQEAENLGKDIMEYVQEQLGGVKVD